MRACCEAPKNVHLDTDVAIANHAEQVAMQAGYSHAMPPGNVTEMTDGGAGADRRLVPRGGRLMKRRRKSSAAGC